MSQFLKYLSGDKVIWMVIILLSMFSIVIAYSSSSNMAYRLTDGDATPYLFKHALFVCAGIAIIYYVHKINFKFFSKISVIGIWVSIILLALTLIFGTSVNSASRWFLGFQPSDLAKVMLIIYVARMLSMKRDVIKNFKEGLLPILIPVGLICGLILPANFSTAAMLFAIIFIMLFVGGAAIKHLLGIIGSAVGVFAILILLNTAFPGLLPRAETWTSRVFAFTGKENKELDNKENYQSNQAKICIANGSIIGKGPGNGTVKNALYSAQSDFVFAVTIEEFGLIFGGGLLILLYIILLTRSLQMSAKLDSFFGSFLVLGLSFSIVFQALINMGVGVNLLPVTGQPLPLISMGGTSILFTCFSLGIILSVSRELHKEEPSVSPSKNENYAAA
ncbi:MAG: FtsW/RodA/SpoVE family cell cycle protein [Bacteroidia bacterium]